MFRRNLNCRKSSNPNYRNEVSIDLKEFSKIFHGQFEFAGAELISV